MQVDEIRTLRGCARSVVGQLAPELFTPTGRDHWHVQLGGSVSRQAAMHASEAAGGLPKARPPA